MLILVLYSRDAGAWSDNRRDLSVDCSVARSETAMRSRHDPATRGGKYCPFTFYHIATTVDRIVLMKLKYFHTDAAIDYV